MNSIWKCTNSLSQKLYFSWPSRKRTQSCSKIISLQHNIAKIENNLICLLIRDRLKNVLYIYAMKYNTRPLLDPHVIALREKPSYYRTWKSERAEPLGTLHVKRLLVCLCGLEFYYLLSQKNACVISGTQR